MSFLIRSPCFALLESSGSNLVSWARALEVKGLELANTGFGQTPAIGQIDLDSVTNLEIPSKAKLPMGLSSLLRVGMCFVCS